MSNYENSSFEILMPMFMEASFKAHDLSDEWRIPDQTRRELSASIGLPAGQTDIYCDMAEGRAERASMDVFIEAEDVTWEAAHE